MSGVQAGEELGRPAPSGVPSLARGRWPRTPRWWRRHTLVRSLALLVGTALVLVLLSEVLSEYRDLQLADAAYYFTVLAGLTVLIGLSGQISLGHGALMAVGAYTVALLIANEQWPIVPALIASVLVTATVGIAVGAAASRLRGPYLAGATLAFAVGLPGLAYQYSGTFGGANGIATNPPAVPSALGTSFPLERWEAWIACAGAVLVAFALYNVIHSGVGRSWRAVRDDEIAATVSGLRVSRVQTLAFILSAACAGLGGGLLAVVLQLANPGAFPLVLSFYLLAAVVIGGLGLAARRGVGRGDSRAPTELDERPRAVVLAPRQGRCEPPARRLRVYADCCDARLAEWDPGRSSSRSQASCVARFERAVHPGLEIR